MTKSRLPFLIIVLLVSLALSMPLIGMWLGNKIIYSIYLLSILGSSYLYFYNKENLKYYDFIFLTFIVITLFSTFYSVSDNFLTDLLYLPLITSFYFSAKFIIKNNYTSVLFYGIIGIFLLFSIYLLFQLSQVGFNYVLYYSASSASNKVEYLTMTLYASLVFLYAFYRIKRKVIKYPLMLYTLFLIIISGARYSILFISLFLLFVFFSSLRNIKDFAKVLSVVLVLFISIINIKPTYLSNSEEIIAFTIQRLSHFDTRNESIKGRLAVIKRSIDAINQKPFIGYGLNCSPKIVKFIYPHNMYLEVWLNSGLIGLIPFLAFTLLPFVYIFFLIKKKDDLDKFIIVSFFYLFFSLLKSFSIYHTPIFFVFISFIFLLPSVKRKAKLLK